jgi:GNAT superfamily N-acetyltransferase
VVAQDWRRRGLGLALLQAAIAAAAHADAGTLRMIFSRHNWPMRKLADKASGRLDLVLDEITVDVALAKSCCSCWPRSARLPGKRARSTARES